VTDGVYIYMVMSLSLFCITRIYQVPEGKMVTEPFLVLLETFPKPFIPLPTSNKPSDLA